MQELREESTTAPPAEPVTHSSNGAYRSESNPELVTEVLPKQRSDVPVKEHLESLDQIKEKMEDLLQPQSLPAATDSDGEATKAKSAKKGKKSKKKKKGEVEVTPQIIDES
jgi:hypothetical protein